MTLQMLIELAQMADPKVGSVLATKLINNAATQFAKDSYSTGNNKGVIDLSGVTLVGSTSTVPVTLSASDGTDLLAFKDDSVDTVTILPSADVLFYINFVQRNSTGQLVNVVSFDIKLDKTIYVYDIYGNPISEFPSELYYLDVEYAKKPTELSALSDEMGLSDDYEEAIADWVIGSMYANRNDLPTIDRLQLEKHFKNRYNETVWRAKKYFRQRNSLATISGGPSKEFEE